MNWWLALLLKPFVGIAYVAFLLVSTRLIATLLWKVLPDSRVKRVLFEGWDDRRTRRGAQAEKRILNLPRFMRR